MRLKSHKTSASPYLFVMGDRTYSLVVSQIDDEAVRAMNIIGVVHERTIVRSGRKEIMEVAIRIYRLVLPPETPLNLHKLAQVLDAFLDFRSKTDPEKSIDVQTIERELHRLCKHLSDCR